MFILQTTALTDTTPPALTQKIASETFTLSPTAPTTSLSFAARPTTT